jgi:thioredoxin-related protein
MKKVFLLIIISPLFVVAQVRGIAFEHNLSWKEVLQKANAENKYVLVDCYTSWCGPCKLMDKTVYTNDSLGDFIGKEFIAIKMQMDNTPHDSVEIQRWYTTAHEFEAKYQINVYPSFLFFSPDGHAVHKDVGATDVQGFITLAKRAMDPKQQYYTLVSEYQHGGKNYELMAYLANTATRLGEDSLASVIAGDYLHYLQGLSDIELLTKSNLTFIDNYRNIVHSNDQLFKRYCKHKKEIDSVMGSQGYAEGFVTFEAYKEEVKPKVNEGIKDNTEPNWTIIKKTIDSKYGRGYAENNVLKGKVAYYRARKEWGNYVKCFVRVMEIEKIKNWPNGPGVSDIINNNAFEVFKYSKDKKELEEALAWVEHAMTLLSEPNANELDTKANILYKLGRKSEGLALEEQSHNLAPEDKEIENTYAKMKNGLPTWQ